MDSLFQAADRALQMLEAFDAEGKELGVSELATRLSIHRSTASRLAATLASRGFLERVPGLKTFRLGPQMVRLGLFALGTRSLISVARPVMARLARDTGETVNLASLDGNHVVNVLQADGPHLVGVGSWTGRRTPLHCVANGKVLLAFGGAKLGPGPFERYTRHTITTAKALRAEIDEVKRQGWAFNVGEMEEGLHAVSAPVFDAFERLQGAISISGPSFRLTTKRLPELARQCLEAAAEIGRGLGAGATLARSPREGLKASAT